MTPFILTLVLSAAQPTKTEPVILRGDGQQATRRFDIDRGLTVFKLTYPSNRHVAVWLVDREGTKIDLLVNQVGGPSASKAVYVKVAGRYQTPSESR